MKTKPLSAQAYDLFVLATLYPPFIVHGCRGQALAGEMYEAGFPSIRWSETWTDDLPMFLYLLHLYLADRERTEREAQIMYHADPDGDIEGYDGA